MPRKKGSPAMSEKKRRAIRELAEELRKNSPRIKKLLAKRRKKANPALIFVAAQYFDCLDRLAKE